MHLKIHHKTEYSYTDPVRYALQKVRLRPIDSALQDVRDWSVDITGGKLETSYRDHYGNHVDLVSITPGAQHISIEAHGTVDTKGTTGILGMAYGAAPLWHFKQATPATRPGPGIAELSKVIGQSDTVLDGLHALSAAIAEKLPYKTGVTTATTTAEDALSSDAGVCQDHAQIFISAARVAGIPARYVSGYLMMDDRVDQDATHAWAEAHVENLGWVGFDISNGLSPDLRYVCIATGRDARDASPIAGLRMGTGDETLIVSLQVQQ